MTKKVPTLHELGTDIFLSKALMCIVSTCKHLCMHAHTFPTLNLSLRICYFKYRGACHERNVKVNGF